MTRQAAIIGFNDPHLPTSQLTAHYRSEFKLIEFAPPTGEVSHKYGQAEPNDQVNELTKSGQSLKKRYKLSTQKKWKEISFSRSEKNFYQFKRRQNMKGRESNDLDVVDRERERE